MRLAPPPMGPPRHLAPTMPDAHTSKRRGMLPNMATMPSSKRPSSDLLGKTTTKTEARTMAISGRPTAKPKTPSTQVAPTMTPTSGDTLSSPPEPTEPVLLLWLRPTKVPTKGDEPQHAAQRRRCGWGITHLPRPTHCGHKIESSLGGRPMAQQAKGPNPLPDTQKNRSPNTRSKKRMPAGRDHTLMPHDQALVFG